MTTTGRKPWTRQLELCSSWLGIISEEVEMYGHTLDAAESRELAAHTRTLTQRAERLLKYFEAKVSLGNEDKGRHHDARQAGGTMSESLQYIASGSVPKSTPKGRLLMHNMVRHTINQPAGVNGFRAWIAIKLPEGFSLCKCGWSALQHYSAVPNIKCLKRVPAEKS